MRCELSGMQPTTPRDRPRRLMPDPLKCYKPISIRTLLQLATLSSEFAYAGSAPISDGKVEFVSERRIASRLLFPPVFLKEI